MAHEREARGGLQAENVAEAEEHGEGAQRHQHRLGGKPQQGERADAGADHSGRQQDLDLAPVGLLAVGAAQDQRGVKSSARTSGIANWSGWDSASSGTEISAEPKPVIPRMKYALISMHITSTMSAN